MGFMIAGILGLCLLYLWCLKGRTSHQRACELRGWSYAHRGLHGGGLPENSIPAFQAALEAGYGVELDIHLMRDGNLAVIHDASLKRTAGADVKIEELTTGQLGAYSLEGTGQTIPEFRQVLELFAGRAPLIVELKSENGNYAALCEAACKILDGYDGLYCMESFDPRCVRWLRRHRPDIIRGQLSENWMKSGLKLPWVLKFAMTFHLGNVYTRPDFIACRYEDRKTFGIGLCRRLWKVQGVSWTIRDMEAYRTATADGWLPIFENIRP